MPWSLLQCVCSLSSINRSTARTIAPRQCLLIQFACDRRQSLTPECGREMFIRTDLEERRSAAVSIIITKMCKLCV